MAKNVNNRYIQFYTAGSTAVKVQIQDEQTWAPLPEAKPKPKILLPVDPVAIIGFVVAICMLVMMTAGINRLNETRREVAEMEHYVAQLTAQNKTLTETYAQGYKPDEIRQQALDMGMVPAEDIPVKHIYITMPLQPEPVTTRDQITTFLSDLFA